ncbi:MAG: stage III sporulation protein AD [Eubacteriales bacterium]|nr:stage III sporulation protein AD [Eubacteriales bacterium]MDD3199527.1 stage III sporulation protein AD [Eubacteriales bacterium]MDD4122170.1 stage III sporulation protein AD [Eubacteriales bacterium]MDD4629866.1 stage III sporulation protein AD [Eubacteriales bacterium]
MDTDIFRIAAIGLCGVILSSIVKGYKPEFATYVIITTVMVIFIIVIYKLTYVFEFLGEIYNQLSYGRNFFPIILKVLAVAYIADFTAQICRDSGEAAIAGKVELAGKVMIFYLAIPIIMAIMELLNYILTG